MESLNFFSVNFLSGSTIPMVLDEFKYNRLYVDIGSQIQTFCWNIIIKLRHSLLTRRSASVLSHVNRRM